ncbi:hypothetical protein [Actinomyces ruminis]|uniref:Uncharacterized protein n=1 Tax=Actinomyces ruminis TaxID=1937003 RepID=A0ABX4MA86_9ACTO|nr:hypothetical protein [Actinomyces ruminis]PHP52098.1 hypothetical protein BW737_012045 [Actinomyces ruminis]
MAAPGADRIGADRDRNRHRLGCRALVRRQQPSGSDAVHTGHGGYQAEPTSRQAASSNTATHKPLAREEQAASTPHSLTTGAAAPDESAFLNGEVIVPEQCAWNNDEGRVTLVDGFASVDEDVYSMSVTVRQTAVVTLADTPYRAVVFSCWGGGNLVYDVIGFYDDAAAPPAIQTDIQFAAGPYQSNAISAVEGSLKPIEGGFHLQWVGEFLPTDEACSACATGAAEADFVWNGSTFDVTNKVTWQEQD